MGFKILRGTVRSMCKIQDTVKHNPYQMGSMSNSLGLVNRKVGLLEFVGQVKFLGKKIAKKFTLQTFIYPLH